MGKKAEELKCDTNGDLNLRNAWTRRNLAYDQAGLASCGLGEVDNKADAVKTQGTAFWVSLHYNTADLRM